MNVFAYVDPAATALIWQILAGVTITLGVVLGIWWRKISTFFKGLWTKLFGKKQSEATKLAEADQLMSEVSDGEDDATASKIVDSDKTVDSDVD